MGNLHAVMFVDDIAAIDLEHEGPRSSVIPRSASDQRPLGPGPPSRRGHDADLGARQRHHPGLRNRAAAVCVAAVLAGHTDRKVLIHLPGGDLTIEWRESDNHVYMTGRPPKCSAESGPRP